MLADKALYLHIGLPKTGTTYLQREIFPRIEPIDYLNVPKSDIIHGNRGPMYGIVARSFKRSAVLWSEFGDELFSDLIGTAKDMYTPGRNLLISDEGIGTGARRPHLLRSHLVEFSKKASEWGFTSLRVVCTFRRQDQWLGSHYAQVSDRIHKASQRTFEAYIARLLDKSSGYYDHGIRLDYKTLRDQLVSAVGEKNALMLPYELLTNEPVEYVRQLLDFLGAEGKNSLPGESLRARSDSDGAKHNVRSRATNVWDIRSRTLSGTRTLALRPRRMAEALGLPARVPLRFPELGRGKTIRLTEDLTDKVIGTYARSNRRLAADLDMDLEQYGYY